MEAEHDKPGRKSAARVYEEALNWLVELRLPFNDTQREAVRGCSLVQALENLRRELAHSRRMAISGFVNHKVPKELDELRRDLSASGFVVAMAFAKAELGIIHMKQILKRARKSGDPRSPNKPCSR